MSDLFSFFLLDFHACAFFSGGFLVLLFLLYFWAAYCLIFQGGMSAQSVNLSSLTQRHAIKVASAASVEQCCLAIGEVVGLESILSASRVNGAAVIFLDSVDKANVVVEHGVTVGGEFIPVLPLSLPSKRVTLSNVPPFMSDDILIQALSRYGKLVSPIKKNPDKY